jgi:hypothetical protein
MKASINMFNKDEKTVKDEIVFYSLKDLISGLVSIPLRYEHSSPDAMKENFNTCCDLTVELCQLIRPEKDKTDPDSKKLKTELTRTATRMSMLKDMLSDFSDREAIKKFIYDVVLSFEGTGRLAGFNMCNAMGDFIKKNPEIHSVSEIPPVKERFLQRKIYVKEETDS